MQLIGQHCTLRAVVRYYREKTSPRCWAIDRIMQVGKNALVLFVDRYYRQDETALLSLRCDAADRTSQDCSDSGSTLQVRQRHNPSVYFQCTHFSVNRKGGKHTFITAILDKVSIGVSVAPLFTKLQLCPLFFSFFLNCSLQLFRFSAESTDRSYMLQHAMSYSIRK